MKNWLLQTRMLMSLGGAAMLTFAGCQSQQTTSSAPASSPAPTASAPAPRAAAPSSGYGPSYTTFDQGGVTYVRGSMGFPTGLRDSSGILLEKTVPAEVMVGQPFSYTYTLTNVSGVTLANIELEDIVSGNFDPGNSTPAADSVEGDTATWTWDEMAPGQSYTVRVNGTAAAEGIIENCGIVRYDPILCETIRVVRADLQLVKNLPSSVTSCDPIPATFTVSNTGSSRLTNVVISDPLPSGLTTADGMSSVRFDVGTLNPGESRTFNSSLLASRTGTFENTATATSAQGVSAEDSDSVVVTSPVLTISCDAPDERFIGRPINVCVDLANVGDAATRDVVVRMPVPAGVTFQGATRGGTLQGTEVIWNVSALNADSDTELCATFTAFEPGVARFTASASGYCVDSVSTACSTVITGIPAILLEVIDLEDPIEVGSTVTYEITVTNQGSAPGTNIVIECELEGSQTFVSGSGATSVRGSGNSITMAPVSSLAPKQQAVWRVVVRADEADDVRFTVSMNSDQIGREVRETEATNQY